MRLHDLEFFAGQPSRFEQNLVGNADFAYVVQKSSQYQFGDAFVTNTHCFGKGDGIAGNAVVMGIGIRVTLGNGITK